LHRTLACAYEQLADAEPERSIAHWHGAGDPARALEYAAAAAARAAHKLAFHRAAALYQRALELCAEGDSRRAGWYAALAESLANAGRSSAAAEAYATAARLDPAQALPLRCRALQHYLRCGKRREGDALLETLLREVELPHPRTQPGLIAHIACSRLRRALHGFLPNSERPNVRRGLVLEAVFRECSIGDPVRGALLQSLFHEHAERSGDPLARFTASAWDTYSYTFVHGYSGARGSARRLAKLTAQAAELQSPYADATLSFVRCAIALYESRYHDAEPHGTRAERIYREQCPGAYWEESMCAALRFSMLEITGPLTSLQDEAPKLLRRAHERSDEFTQAMLSRIMSQALLASDQPAEAIRFLASRNLQSERELDLPRWLVALSSNDALCYAGRVEEAWQSFDAHYREFRKSPLAGSKFLQLTSVERHARSALRMSRLTGDPSYVPVVVQHIKTLERAGWPDADAAAWALRAALHLRRGERADAARLLRRAVDAMHESGAALLALATERSLALIGVDSRSRSLAAIDADLLEGGAKNPARWADLFLPGFGDDP
jgi:tetratricopeptide (TPR) repeat protein